jgi:cysteinyl-tRNA synthetase
MDNDLNTSLAVTALYDVLKAKTNDLTKLHLIADFDSVLSLDLIGAANKLKAPKEAPKAAEDTHAGDPMAAMVEEQIALRKAAKAAKNFAEADRIRDELKAQGIILEDTPQGVKWSRA